MKAASSLVRNDNSADQIVRHLDALDRLQARDRGEFVVHGGKARPRLARERSRRTCQPRRDGVHRDAVGGDVAGKPAGEADDAAFAGDVMRKAGGHRAERARRHAHHAAPFARPHARHEGGGDEKGAVEIDGREPCANRRRSWRQNPAAEKCRRSSPRYRHGRIWPAPPWPSPRPSLPWTRRMTTASALRPAASTSFTVSRPSARSAIGDMHAVLGKTFGKSLPDAVGAAGDDGDLVLMPFAHEASP